MDVYESGVWILRFMVIMITSATIIMLLLLFVINVNPVDARADIAAARIFYDGGFWDSPGVIDKSKFTQEAADRVLVFDSREIMSLTAKATIKDYETEDEIAGIIYNNDGYLKLSNIRNLKGVKSLERQMPAMMIDGDEELPVLLHVEVLYE